MSSNFIGISYGTQYSTVSVIEKEGKVSTIANEDGERNIPCFVEFTDHEEIVGTQAKQHAIRNPSRTFSSFRNLIGLKYNELEEYSLLPKNVLSKIQEKDNVPVFTIEENSWTAEDLTTKLFVKLRETAEMYLGHAVDSCVVSYPDHFSKYQQDQLKMAVGNAGFAEIILAKEHVAAYYAFSTEKQKVDETFVIADFGAQNFNVTILQQSKGLISIVGSADENELGGQNFDDIIVQLMSEEFKRKTKMDISDDRRALAKLKYAGEQTKRILSQKDIAPCFVESLYEGADLNSVVNRGRFEGMAEPLIRKCETLIKSTLELAAVHPSTVDQIHLIGGSSRIPRYQALMKSIFTDETKIINYTEPDEMISRGCASIAKDIIEIGLEDYKEALASEKVYTNVHILTKDLGIYKNGSEFFTVIPKNTPIPCRRKFTVERKKGEASITIPVIQHQKDMKQLASLVLEDMATDASSVINCTMTFEKGHLIVHAVDKVTGVHGEVKIATHA